MTYEPQEDSYLLLKHVKELAHGRVLDMGTGSGILAVGASEKPEVIEVIAVDSDARAIDELKKKRISKIKTFQGNMFLNIGGNFDVIIFNPPYLPFDEDDPDVALDGGEKGYELIERFLHGAKNYISPRGFILLVFSSRTGKEDVDRIIKEEGYESETLEQKSLAFFEELFVYKITLAKQ
jgi:release factor glutamine methyltransferase